MKNKIGYLPNGTEVEIIEIVSNGFLVKNTYNIIKCLDDGTLTIDHDSDSQYYDEEPFFIKEVLDNPVFPKLNLEYSNKYNMLEAINKEIILSQNKLSSIKKDMVEFTKMDEWKIDLSKYATNGIFCFIVDNPMPINYKKADGVRFSFTKSYYRGEKNTNNSIQISTYDTWNTKDIDTEYEIFFNIDDALKQVKDRIDKKINSSIVNNTSMNYSFQHNLLSTEDTYLSEFAKEYVKELKVKKTAIELEQLEKQQSEIQNKINNIKNEINQK